MIRRPDPTPEQLRHERAWPRSADGRLVGVLPVPTLSVTIRTGGGGIRIEPTAQPAPQRPAAPPLYRRKPNACSRCGGPHNKSNPACPVALERAALDALLELEQAGLAERVDVDGEEKWQLTSLARARRAP